MKTYKEAKDIFGKPIRDTVILQDGNNPPKIIKKDVHKEEWAEYEKTLKPTQTTKKTRRKKHD